MESDDKNNLEQKHAEVPKSSRKRKGITIKNETITVIICLVIVLCLTGIINFKSLFDFSTPSSAKAEEVCAKYGNNFSTKEKDFAPEGLRENITNIYSCTTKDENEKNNNAKMSFVLYELNEDALNNTYLKENVAKSEIYPEVGVLEDSNSYFKVAMKRNGYASYIALYKQYYATVEASSMEFAEDILKELDFPDRNRITTMEYDNEVNEIDNYNQEIVNKVATALLDYQVKEGSLPPVMPDSPDSNKQTNIDGTGNTEFDVFYNSLEELKDREGKKYLIDVMNPFIEIEGSWDEKSNNIFIRYGYYCNTYDGENYYAQNAQDATVFAVTLKSADGDSICAGTMGSSEEKNTEYPATQED